MPPSDKIHETLKHVFGFDTFRPNQESIVRETIAGKDCFTVMPTGGGKSLCYQLPARLMEGACIVVSPLISLMKDQVDAATVMGLRAASINSSQPDRERTGALRALNADELDLVYVSPERFSMESFLNCLRRATISFFAIDEAHCISEWGHNFRPDYLSLSEMVRQFPSVPVSAFTATATPPVQQDIIERLRLREPHVVRASFNRPNLSYEVIPKQSVEIQILEFVERHKGSSGIVYRTTRKSVDETASLLAREGISVLPYHAGLGDDERVRNQERFDRDEIDVVVATIAFGMGIDKPNVRYVLHGDLPKNMESYYQETGRAGRDGDPSQCVLFFGRGDIPKIRYFIDQVEDRTEQERLFRSLNDMVSYAGNATTCRRRRILSYFGESWPEENCGGCDVCCRPSEKADVTVDAQKVLSAIVRTGSRFGAAHIIDIVSGADTKRIRQFGHDLLPTYGTGSEKPKKHWREIIDHLLSHDVLHQSDGRFPVLGLNAAARSILRGERPFEVVRPKRIAELDTSASQIPENHEPELFEQLRALRRRLATERSVPPYVIFSDKSLRDMAAKMPLTEERMLSVHGVGDAKLEQYGQIFLREIQDYVEANPDKAPPTDQEYGALRRRNLRPRKSRKTELGATFLETHRLLNEGKSIEQIAEERSLACATIFDHVERLVREGKISDIERFVETDRISYIEELLSSCTTGLLRDVMESSNREISYEDVRMVRARRDASTPVAEE